VCSKFNDTEDLAASSREFNKGVKIFSTSNSRADQRVKFGSPRDGDLGYGIKAGRIPSTGYTHTLETNSYLLIRYMSSKLQANGKKTSPVITLQMLGFFRIY